jgi:type VI secretion system protein ImpJ
MFLRPQHFQAAERYWTDLIHASKHWDSPYHYGLRSLEISPEAIANSQLDVSRIEARFRDGTLASRAAGQSFSRIDLKTAFERETSVTVYLAVPKLKMGQANVAGSAAVANSRYVEQTLSVQDESSGGNDQEIGYRDLNLRLLLSTQDLAGFEVLPIARIQRAGDKEGTPRIDPEYIPPLITVDAWPELKERYIRVIYDLIGQKIDVITQQVQSRGITLASQHPGDLERVLMLRVLNEAYAILGCLSFSAGLHPFAAYSELCRIVGMLAIFGPARRVEEIPNYDHDDLARIFRWTLDRVRSLLDAVRDYEYERRDFMGVGRGMMQVALEPKWVQSDWQWYVGVQGPQLKAREIQQLLEPGRLDWKMASSSRVDQIYKLRVPGLSLVLLPQPPRELPTSGDWIYYEVSRSKEVEWIEVTRSLTLAVRFNEQLVTNANELQGQTKLQLRLGEDRAELGFSLFAVPRPGERSRP